MDESTSALDPVLEQRLMNRLLNHRKGRTTILVSHRPSVILRADWIVYIERGQVKQQDNPTVLRDSAMVSLSQGSLTMSNLQRRSEQIPALLTPLQADDFLPELGGWSKTLGQRALAVGAASVMALALWPWQETVRAGGVIRPAGENTIVQSQLDGVLARVLVKENQQVKQGQPLAELDRRSLENERRKLEAELNQSLAQQRDSQAQTLDVEQQTAATRLLNQAQLNSARRDLDSAASTLRYREVELQRYRGLLSSGAVAMTVVEEKQAQAILARNDLAKARQALREQQARGTAELARLGQGSNQASRDSRELFKQVDQTRARLEEVKRALLNSVIKAPKAGTVIVNNLRHAQQVIRGGEVLAQIAPIKDICR